jgi:hypothetical protein
MTTKEQWKAGILIGGMLLIAVIVNSRWPDRHVTQSQVIPAYRPPPTPTAPTPVEPQYPIHKTIAINQNGWSEEITVGDGEQLEWNILDENAWLDTRANRTEEFRQFPLNDSRWKPLRTDSGTRTLEFRITPGTPVQTASVEVTVRKAAGGGFFARERTLPSVTPSLTDVGVKAGPKWPRELTPTRYGKFPPDGMGPNSGNIAVDTVYPIEDVLYRIMPGWTITPLTEDGVRKFEVACAPDGFRLRVLNPDTSIVVKFKMTKEQNNVVTTSDQKFPANQSAKNWPSTYTTPPVTRPVRPYVAPRQPSYYPTSPTGPSYYPSSPPRHRPN